MVREAACRIRDTHGLSNQNTRFKSCFITVQSRPLAPSSVVSRPLAWDDVRPAGGRIVPRPTKSTSAMQAGPLGARLSQAH
jgi:hypothetical protein